MRIALLIALQRTAEGQLRMALPFLGQTLLERQLECALTLGAERIVCLSPNRSDAVTGIQHRAERLGVDFHHITSALALSGLVSADNDLILMSDGVVIEPEAIPVALKTKRGVLALAGEGGEAAGTERIDAQHFWAGLLVAKGDVIAHLADLPADSDVASLLLRLALQARTPVVLVAQDKVDAGAVFSVTSAKTLDQRANHAFLAAIPNSLWSGPGTAIAAKVISALGPRVIPKGTMFAHIAMGAASMGALILAGIGMGLPAMLMLLIAALTGAAGGVIADLRSQLGDAQSTQKKAQFARCLLDISFAGSIILLHLPSSPIVNLSLAPICIAAVRAAEDLALSLKHTNIHAFASDRTVLAVILVAATAWNSALVICAAVALGSLAYLLFFGARRSIR